MLKLLHGELPANTSNKTQDALKHQLFHHYLNHKLSDIPGSKINSDKSVLECIISSFNKEYQPERYSRKSELNHTSKDDSLEDIRSVAHLAVWESIDKYLWGIDKKINNSLIHVEYREKYDFCIFASEQVKYKLRTHLRLLNTNRICGKLPDSDKVRGAYSKLPKLKLEKKSLSASDLKIVAKENNIEFELIKLVDNFVTSKTNSGDETITNERGEDYGNKWEQLENSENYNNLSLNQNIEEETNTNLVIEKFNKIKLNFLKNLSVRDREILNHTKFKELNNTKELTLNKLGKKFKLSSERIRQISEIQFIEFKKIVIKNKKNLELK